MFQCLIQGIRLQIKAYCGEKKEQQKNCQFRETCAHTECALVLTFRFLCLINLLIVSYSIFILFCVHVTAERNTGDQGVLHRNTKRGSVQAVWVDVD